jgi:translocator protein
VITQVVPVAWTTLYTLSGFASWRVWKIGGSRAKIPLLLYAIKLLLNWLWPLIAFGLGSLLGALIDTIFLQIFVVLTGVAFYRIDKFSGLVYVPYFLYLCYVFVLCTHIYVLNN